MHWDEAYVITLDGDIWSARYRSSADELRAHTSTELREFIRSDYAYRQRADLIAYDPGDERDEDGEGADSDQPTEGEGGTGADSGPVQSGPVQSGREQHDDAGAAGRGGTEVSSFAGLRGERMSM